MSKNNAIKINKGPSGFGGPLTVKPTEEKNITLYNWWRGKTRYS